MSTANKDHINKNLDKAIQESMQDLRDIMSAQTDFDKKLDDILLRHGAEQGELHHSLKQAIQALYRTREATLIMEALIIENKCWLTVSKAFQRGMLPVDFKDRITEITDLTNQQKGEQ